MKLFGVAVGLCITATVPSLAQQALTNASIDKLSTAHVGDSLIIRMINTQPGAYDVSPNALTILKSDGVSDSVLSSMMARDAESTASKSDLEDLDIGIYHKVNGEWLPVSSEHVNWKTGGVLKSVFTDGIIKGDINGHINGGKSVTSASSLDFLIRTPDGVDGTDFQLVQLHQKSDSREFRHLTGGVFHASGGSSRDEVVFRQRRVAKHTYQLTLPALQAGEYAFLAPGWSASSASGSVGKAYTFHLTEAQGEWQP